MNAKLYVGNLSFDAEEASLSEIFEKFGEVSSVKIIKDRDTGRSKGFGFVEFANKDEAQKAVDELNGQEVLGRPLRIDFAKERSNSRGGAPSNKRPRRGGPHNNRGGGRQHRGGGRQRSAAPARDGNGDVDGNRIDPDEKNYNF